MKLDADGKPTAGAGDRASKEEIDELRALLSELRTDSAEEVEEADAE